jgi:hypothetical protein
MSEKSTGRHRWTKKRNGRFIYWECVYCGCTKQKDWGMPWMYFTRDEASPGIFKSPKCKKIEQLTGK